jgi:hypothetical protein
MLNWTRLRVVGGLLVISLVLLAGCGGPAVTSPAPWPPTMPVSITPAPGDVVWVLDAGLGAVTSLDGTLQPGQTVYILAGITEGLSPPSPTSSSRRVVFALACGEEPENRLRWWLEPDPGRVAGCGDSLEWVLTYENNRLRLGLALDTAVDKSLAYHLTAATHNPY